MTMLSECILKTSIIGQAPMVITNQIIYDTTHYLFASIRNEKLINWNLTLSGLSTLTGHRDATCQAANLLTVSKKSFGFGFKWRLTVFEKFFL